MVVVTIRPEKTRNARPDTTRERLDDWRANQFHHKLYEGIFEHRPVTMALSGKSAKAGKASVHTMGGG